MTSGGWLTLISLLYIGLFPLWFIPLELIQLLRRKETMSRYVMRRAREGSWFWELFILWFPLSLIITGAWLILHFEAPCILWGWFCWLDWLNA